jgi:glycerol uptake facilitator-like aquaporin
MFEALREHWPEYLMEAAELGMFMISACIFATLLEHPGSPIPEVLPHPNARRPLGVAMGLTAVGIIYSPWGQQSGGHLNPAVTLTFLRAGKVKPWDAVFYIGAQFVGAIAGVLVATYITLEAPISGMSMNPARTFGSALVARTWTSLWIYFTAPPLGMLLAVEVYRWRKGAQGVICAKLHHHNVRRCIFRCGYQAAQKRSPQYTGATV